MNVTPARKPIPYIRQLRAELYDNVEVWRLVHMNWSRYIFREHRQAYAANKAARFAECRVRFFTEKDPDGLLKLVHYMRRLARHLDDLVVAEKGANGQTRPITILQMTGAVTDFA